MPKKASTSTNDNVWMSKCRWPPSCRAVSTSVSSSAQFAISDHQKVAASAGRIEEPQTRELLVELPQLVLVTLNSREFCPKLVEKQCANHLENVALVGVMAADLAALARAA